MKLKALRVVGPAKERPTPSQARVQAVRPNLVEVLDMLLFPAIDDHDVAEEENISSGRGLQYVLYSDDEKVERLQMVVESFGLGPGKSSSLVTLSAKKVGVDISRLAKDLIIA